MVVFLRNESEASYLLEAHAIFSLFVLPWSTPRIVHPISFIWTGPNPVLVLPFSLTFPSEKQSGRNQARKPAHSVAKPENGVDETFEDLLSKYKQIQLELECIRKEETMALEPKGSPAREEAPSNAASITEAKPVPEIASIQSPAATEDVPGPEKTEKKVFQAFNIKPLRQKLLTPAELDAFKNKQPEQQDKDDDGEKEGKLG